MPNGIAVAYERDDSPSVVNTGQSVPNLGPFREQMTAPIGLGEYFDLSRKGMLFTATTATAATLNGLTSPLGAGGTALLALYNPINSGVIAVILRASCKIIAGASATLSTPTWNYIDTVTPHGIT